MRTWFAKEVDKKKESNSSDIATRSEFINTAESSPTTTTAVQARRVIQAPLLPSDTSAPTGNGIRIKAQLNPSDRRIVLMVDRPVLKGYSCWCASHAEAIRWSPLAVALFDQGNVESVLIHEMNVTVTRSVTGQEPDDVYARRSGLTIRKYLELGLPVMTTSFLTNMPSEEQVREDLQLIIDSEVNPGIAAHSGVITLTAVKGNTAYIKMGGGCQGCAASSITLRQGVEQSFRMAVPRLGALLDETDHTAGTNPFFSDLPIGMGT